MGCSGQGGCDNVGIGENDQGETSEDESRNFREGGCVSIGVGRGRSGGEDGGSRAGSVR